MDDKDKEGNESNGDDDTDDGVCGGAATAIDRSVSSHTNLDDLKLVGQLITVCRCDVVRPAFHSVVAVIFAVFIVNFKVADEDIIDPVLLSFVQ